MPGINARTGGPLSGWTHVEQSISRILMTRIGSRVMFRNFGADVSKMIDANATPKVIMGIFVAIAEALDTWEPQGGGVHFPRGHLGDYSISEDKTGAYIMRKVA